MFVVLTVSDGPEEGRKLTLAEGQSITVGREAPADVVFANDGYLSGRHFSVEVTEGTALLRDLESRNKTKVNGQFVREISLAAGDIVLAGHTEFLVDIQDSAHQFETTIEDVDPNQFAAAAPGVYPAGGNPPEGGGEGGLGPPVGAGGPVPNSGQGDVFDAPFDEPAPDAKMAIGEPGVNRPATDGSGGDALPPPDKKKSSASPIQSITASGSPLFGGGIGDDGLGDGGDSGFGSPFGDVPTGQSGGSPLMSVTGGTGVGPVSPLPNANHQPPPNRDFDSPSSFDPNSPTTPTPPPPTPPQATPPQATPPPPTSQSTSPPATSGAEDRSSPLPNSAVPNVSTPDDMTSGLPLDTATTANQKAPAPADPDAATPPGESPDQDRKHFVVDAAGDVGPLPDVFRHCVRSDCTSGLVQLLAKGDGETEFKISSLLLELKKHFHIALTIHCQKSGLELPQELWSAIPLFDWLPRETSLFYCPVATTLAAVEEGGHLAILDQLWGVDAMVVFLAKRSEQEGLDYLAKLRHHSIPGISGRGNFMGFSWPSVIGQLLQHQAEAVANGILGDQISGVIIEADDPNSWQFVGEKFMIDELSGLPLAIA